MSNAMVLTDRFDRALLYATHVHGGQVRKGTSTPYVAHLLAVAATVIEYGGDEDLAIAALLHDSAEDQGGNARLKDVRNRFGERVARIVEACSDSLADTAGGERKAGWQERKDAYLAHIREADEDVLGGGGRQRRYHLAMRLWGRRDATIFRPGPSLTFYQLFDFGRRNQIYLTANLAAHA